jgi:hypothetical protein
LERRYVYKIRAEKSERKISLERPRYTRTCEEKNEINLEEIRLEGVD